MNSGYTTMVPVTRGLPWRHVVLGLRLAELADSAGHTFSVDVPAAHLPRSRPAVVSLRLLNQKRGNVCECHVLSHYTSSSVRLQVHLVFLQGGVFIQHFWDEREEGGREMVAWEINDHSYCDTSPQWQKKTKGLISGDLGITVVAA